MDFQHCKFLSQEIFTDILAGETRRVDLLVETKLRGEESLIIIHVEPQSYQQSAFAERMFIYFSRLYEKYRRKIIPIALFTYEPIRMEKNRWTMQFPFLDVLRFQFFKVELKNCPWEEYIKQPNPVAAALLSKMGYSEAERVQVKLEFLRMLTKLELNPAKMKLITGFFETYLQLREEEEQQLQEHVKKLHPQEEGKIMELMTSWEKKGMEKGMEKGKKEGMEKGKKEVAKKLLVMGMAIADISQATGLSEEEILSVKQESEE